MQRETRRKRVSVLTVTWRSLFIVSGMILSVCVLCSCVTTPWRPVPPPAAALGVSPPTAQLAAGLFDGFRFLSNYETKFGLSFGETFWDMREKSYLHRQKTTARHFSTLKDMHVSIIRTRVIADGRWSREIADDFWHLQGTTNNWWSVLDRERLPLGMNDPYFHDQFVHDMSALAKAARADDMGVLLVLCDHSMVWGTHVRNGVRLYGNSDVITNKISRDWFADNIVLPIARTCGAPQFSDVIVGFDIMNHAHCLVSDRENGGWEQQPENERPREALPYADVEAFIEGCADAIKKGYLDVGSTRLPETSVTAHYRFYSALNRNPHLRKLLTFCLFEYRGDGSNVRNILPPIAGGRAWVLQDFGLSKMHDRRDHVGYAEWLKAAQDSGSAGALLMDVEDQDEFSPGPSLRALSALEKMKRVSSEGGERKGER